jgi:hypothetical protein
MGTEKLRGISDRLTQVQHGWRYFHIGQYHDCRPTLPDVGASDVAGMQFQRLDAHADAQ